MSPTPVPAYVQSQSAQGRVISTVTTPAMTTTSGSFLVAMAARHAAATFVGSPVSDLYGNSWIQAWTDPNVGGVFGSGALYYAQNISGGAGHTVTFTIPSGTDSLALAVAEFTNVALTFALNSTAHTFNEASGAADPPILSGPLSGVTAGQLLIGSGSVSHGHQTPVSIGLFTDLFRSNSGFGQGVVLAYTITSAIGTYHYAYTVPDITLRSESYGLATFKGSGIAYVQQTGAQSVGGPASITTPAITTSTGNFLVVVAAARDEHTITAGVVTDSYSNTWSVAWINNAGTSGHSACFYAENATGGAGHTFSLSILGSATATSLSVAEFSGVNVSAPLDQVVDDSSGTNPHTTGLTGTTAQAEELLIGGGSVSAGAFYGYSAVPEDWTTIQALTLPISNSDEGVILAYQIAPANGTYEYGMDTGAFGSTSFEAVGIASFEPGEPEPFVNPETSTIQIRRMRRTPHINAEHKRNRHNYLELLAQVGVGNLTGDGVDPQAILRWSDDGGMTWSREHKKSLGRRGAYKTLVRWFQLGHARDRVYELVIADPVEAVLVSAYLDIDIGLT